MKGKGKTSFVGDNDGEETRPGFINSKNKFIPVGAVSETLIEMAKKTVEVSFEKRGARITPPTYTITTASGATQEIAHDETTIETDEERQAWDEYVSNLRLIEIEKQRKQMQIYMNALQVELPDDDSWEVFQTEILGIDVPQEPREKLQHYIETEILITPADAIDMIEAITKATYKGVVEESAVEAAMESFRRNLLNPNPPGDNKNQNAEGNGRIDSTGERVMEPSDDVDGDSHSEELGINASPV